jgi:hypothetical protein
MAPKGKNSRPVIRLVTPVAQALEQAKSDLKRGWHQTTVFDEALERDALRKKLSQERKARRKIYGRKSKKKSKKGHVKKISKLKERY